VSAWECTESKGEPVDETMLALELAVSVATRLERRNAAAIGYLETCPTSLITRNTLAILRGETESR
jgi:hypothetical protein